MKKKGIAIIAAAVLAGGMFIPPVQSAAESALSIFRVSDTKTITISVADIQTLASDMKQFTSTKKQDAASSKQAAASAQERLKSTLQPLESIRDFKAFHITLANSSEKPTLYQIASTTKTFTLDTTKINAALAKLNETPISDTYNGKTISVVTPPAAVAVYSDMTLLETEGVYLNASGDTISTLWGKLSSLSSIPADLRTQLAAIDPTSRDVYLPVVEGLGRSTSLGVTTGYLYSAKDFAQLASTIPAFADAPVLTTLQKDSTTVLVWVKDGVLYALAGKQSDSALTQIARNLR